MLEVSYAGHGHGQPMGIAVLYRFVVADASARLYDGGYARFVCNLYAIAKGEECV